MTDKVSEKLAQLAVQVEAHNRLLKDFNVALNDPEKGILHRLTKIETKLSIVTGIVLVATPILTSIILFVLNKFAGG